MLPVEGEPELVHEAIPAGASILELGAGVGRITHRLLELGHAVTAVDQSPEMLAHIHGARTVCSQIETLELAERFDAVLLASYLFNAPAEQRSVLLRACRRHLRDGGFLVVEYQPAAWFDTVEPGRRRTAEGITITLREMHRPTPGEISATMEYTAGDRRWTQHFTSHRVEEDELNDSLAAAGMAFDAYLTEDHTWFRARAH
jgi:SAM-dependent methyltransferase